MPSKKTYNRFFIILQEDQKGYGLDSNKTPSGYAKLEIRNDKAKSSFYVQNLKKQKGPYCMVLIVNGKSGNELINLGQINIDEGGKADVSNEFDANNVANTNIGMDKVQGAAICKVSTDRVSAVMVGFACGEEVKNWQNYPVAKTIEKIIKEKKEASNSNKEESESCKEAPKPIKVPKPIEVPRPIKETSGLQNEDMNQSEKMIETEGVPEAEKRSKLCDEDDPRIEAKVPIYKACAENKKNMLEIEHIEELNEEDVIESTKEFDVNDIRNLNNQEDDDVDDENIIFEEYEKEIERLKDFRKKHSKKKHYDDDNEWECKSQDSKKIEWSDKDYPAGAMGKFFKEVVYGLEKIGSNENIKNCFWYKAHVDKLEDMYCVYDYNKYSVVFYPMICYYPYISRRGNFMIGYKCDDAGELKYIIYAIPGTRELVDQPYEGKTGFVTFMPDNNNDQVGHWLMYYDVKGNTVVVPVKK